MSNGGMKCLTCHSWNQDIRGMVLGGVVVELGIHPYLGKNKQIKQEKEKRNNKHTQCQG